VTQEIHHRSQTNLNVYTRLLKQLGTLDLM